MILSTLFWLVGGAPASPSRDEGKSAQIIRAQYLAVNRGARHYKKIERELSGYSAEGGTLTGYFSGPVLWKMAAIHYRETGRTDEEYYFWKGRMFFVIVTKSIYDQPLGSDILRRPPGHVVSVDRDRFYFDRGRLFRWLNQDKKPMAVDGTEARTREGELLQTAHEFIVLLRSPARHI